MSSMSAIMITIPSMFDTIGWVTWRASSL